MNIIFLGSAEFAVPSLRALLAAGYPVSCVVTQPDKKSGRHLHLQGTPVKAIAEENGLKIYQPDNINSPEAARFIKSLNPELLVVIAYGQILSQAVLDTPKIFTVNVHGSLLPKYRGAAPINWALINGEKIIGVSVMRVIRKMDAGPVILQRKLDISEQGSVITVESRLADLGALSLLESIKLIEDNNYKLNAQDDAQVTFAPKLRKADGLIKWDKPAKDIYNLIRGCLVWPGAFTYYKGKLLKIYKATVTTSPRHHVATSPGELIQVSKEGIIVATGKDDLNIQELQIEGKKIMGVEEFVAGHKVLAGEILGKK